MTGRILELEGGGVDCMSKEKFKVLSSITNLLPIATVSELIDTVIRGWIKDLVFNLLNIFEAY